MHVAFERVINDLGLSSDTTDDFKAAALAVLQTFGELDDTEYTGTTALEAYQFVESRFAALNLPAWFVRKYKTLANHRIQFYSRGY